MSALGSGVGARRCRERCRDVHGVRIPIVEWTGWRPLEVGVHVEENLTARCLVRGCWELLRLIVNLEVGKVE